jgi:hypothetical protein
MTDTPNLGLPCIEGSQAQKHITHNDALRILDSLVQLVVLDRDLTAPPGSPSDGQRWIVKAGATGAWAGHDNVIAAWQDGAWLFSAPQTGWLAYMADEGALVAWSGSAWVDAIAALTSLNNMTLLGVGNMTLLGVGTNADATNPFSAKLNNTLFTAKTVAEGGDGDLRYKLSKEASANTLSFLFQDGYSGRAEIGLTGDDDFHFKVSADGSTWLDALVIDKSSGRVTLSQGFANPPAPFDAIAWENLALNADHIVSQANIDAAVTGIGSAGGVETYVTDQWKIRAKGSLRVSGQRISLISLPGIKYALRTTITTTEGSLGSSDYLQVSQPIEGLRALRLGLGAAGAADIAVGVYVRSSVTGTFAVELSNSARDRSICKLVTIAAADTWTWVAFSGSPGAGATAFAGDTSGTWLNDTGVGLRVGVTLAAGSALQGSADAWSGADVMTTSAQTNLAATASATFEVTALCVFAGYDLPSSSRVPFVMLAAEKALGECQRYYEKSYDTATAPAAATYTGASYLVFNASGGGTAGGGDIGFRVTKRATPTVTCYSPATGTSGKARDFANSAEVTPVFPAATSGSGPSGVNGFGWYCTPSVSGNLNFSVHWTADARLS